MSNMLDSVMRSEHRLDDMLAFHADLPNATLVDTPAGKAIIIGGNAVFCTATHPLMLQWLLDALRGTAAARIERANQTIARCSEGKI